jgi:hydrocephalus-inducing protein
MRCGIQGKLVMVYQNHPRRDTVDLIGDINYPNIKLEYGAVDFGVILNDTTKSMVVKVHVHHVLRAYF